MKKPLIGITAGDPAGVGPEICLRALSDRRVRRACTPVVFCDAKVMQAVSRKCSIPAARTVIGLAEWKRGACVDGPALIDCGAIMGPLPQPGKVQTLCGKAAYRYIAEAVAGVMAGRLAALATAPINKEALRLAGIREPGHTEILARLTGARRVRMMMACDDMAVSLATIHVPYRDVSALLSKRDLVETMRLTADAMRRLGKKAPAITVCGLNPHAGESGLFGNEEKKVIIPAIAAARKLGLNVTGPLPPDTAFIPALRKATDAYIVMYHDQGLIPFKMLAFDRGVNITLGLPIVRTSVDHGTAFDIAWKGKASPESLIQSVLWAVKLTSAGTHRR